MSKFRVTGRTEGGQGGCWVATEALRLGERRRGGDGSPRRFEGRDPLRYGPRERYNREIEEDGRLFEGAGRLGWELRHAESGRSAAGVHPGRSPDTPPAPSRNGGADPARLARQISRYGKSIGGMPSPLVIRGQNGELQLIDGVTRATRVGKLLPGQQITVQVIETRPRLDLSRFPTVGDKLP
jgi:hypothetical protein